MRVPNDPNYRQTMLHPPEFDGQYAAPGMTLSSDEHSTARRTQTPAGIFFRNLWVNIWGWQQVNSESSMFLWRQTVQLPEWNAGLTIFA
jgi:hypothetical protein